jgi:hypothetical protein
LNGALLPGTLGYPEYGVASVCFGCSDIELHSLFDTFHLGSNLLPYSENRNRGGWYDSKDGPVFYKCGFAVTDW